MCLRLSGCVGNHCLLHVNFSTIISLSPSCKNRTLINDLLLFISFFFIYIFFIEFNMSDEPQLVSNLLLPELERQLKEDPKLWPNIKGLFIVTVTKKKKARATW